MSLASKFFIHFLVLLSPNLLFATNGEPQIVTQQIFRSASEEVVYAALHAGDVIDISVTTTSKKPLKAIAFGSYGGQPSFSTFKQSGEVEKTINISQTGVYALAVNPGGLTGKVFSVTITRRPAEDAPEDFQTEVVWVTVIDSSYTMEYVTEMVSIDTIETPIYSSVERVNSQTNLGGNSQSQIDFQLPAVQVGDLDRRYPIGWAYEIAVDDNGKNAFEAFCKVAGKVAELKYGALASMAIGTLPAIRNAPEGEAIKYQVLAMSEGQTVSIHNGKSSLVANPVNTIVTGPAAIVLINENMVTGLDVHLQVVAVEVQETYAVREVPRLMTKERLEPRVAGESSHSE